MKEYADYYCTGCEQEVDMFDCYTDSNGDLRCKHCDSLIEENVDVCVLCGKKLYKNDGHWVCEDCMKRLANPTDVLKIINEDYESEELTDKFLSMFFDKATIREILIAKLNEKYEEELSDQKVIGRKSFNHTVEDNIIDFYKSEEHLFTDDCGDFATGLLEEK